MADATPAIGHRSPKLTPPLSGKFEVMHVRPEQLAEEIALSLHDGYSVNLVGHPGSGRTFVVRSVADRASERGFAVLALRGVAALRDRPLAPLAVAGVDVASNGSPAPISAAVQALLGRLPAGRGALLIDDADDLDAATAGVVAAAHAERAFPVLAVTRPAGRHRSPVRSLIAGLQPGVRLRMEPLGFDQLHQEVHEMLPGTVDPSLVAQIATLSGGLPGLVRAIIDSGRRTGSIVQQHAVWRATGGLWDARLAQAVEPLLVDLDDDEAEALAKLAQAGTVPVVSARDIVADSMLARLDELGLIEVADTPMGALVGVFPPLAAEHLRAARSVATLDTRAEREPLTDSLVVMLNTRIMQHRRMEVATLRAAWTAEPSAQNATLLLRALNEASAPSAEFETVFAGTRPDGQDTIWGIRFLAWQALHRAVMRRDLARARHMLSSCRASAPQFDSQLRVFEAEVCLAAGAMPEAELLEPGSTDDATSLARLDAARRMVAVYAGRTADALSGLPDHDQERTDRSNSVRQVAALAHMFNGDLDVGIEMALRAMAEAEDIMNPGLILVYAYVAGFGMMFAGRLDDAQALLDPVLALTGPTMVHEYYHTGVLGLAALAASWRGQNKYSEALRAQAEAAKVHSGPFPDILRVGRPDEDTWARVDERLAGGHVAAGISLAATAAEMCPQEDRARAVTDRALATQSPFLAELGRYIEAATAADPDRLADCASAFREQGALLYAVKAGVTRALALRARGDLAASARQADAAWAEIAAHTQAPVGLFTQLARAVGFSARELEIARLLAGGMSASAIASTLSLSYRTVENYLSSACRRLGATGRADLVRAVSTWAGGQ